MSQLLMTPGPTNIPKRSVNKMLESFSIHHRSKEYSLMYKKFNENLKYVFQTKNEIITLPSSGTGGLESSILNLLNENDKVLFISVGVFGDRFKQMGEINNLDIDFLDIKRGRGFYLEEVKKVLKKEHKAVIVTHNETSTAVTNDIKNLSKLVKKEDRLLIVDAVSSLGAIDIKMDDWDIDVLITGSQKSLMSPAGMCFVGLSDKAIEICKKNKRKTYYFDYISALEYLKGDYPKNPYTPPVQLIACCLESLNMIKEEGLQNTFKRHDNLAKYMREELTKRDYEFYTHKDFYSNTLTAIKIKEQNAVEIQDYIKKKHNIYIATGQQDLKNKIIRIGHMGNVNKDMIYRTLNAIDDYNKNK